ncbi:hypothetical protein [Pseudofrankia inefficax]|nr:hypothetical protein [Pseudofrankia inefficax]
MTSSTAQTGERGAGVEVAAGRPRPCRATPATSVTATVIYE